MGRGGFESVKSYPQERYRGRNHGMQDKQPCLAVFFVDGGTLEEDRMATKTRKFTIMGVLLILATIVFLQHAPETTETTTQAPPANELFVPHTGHHATLLPAP